jgi:hypothetical protein
MPERELNLIILSRPSPEGVISPHVCTFDCEYPLKCRGNCIICPPVKNRLAKITPSQDQDIPHIVDIASYDLLTGIVGQIESTRLETDRLLYKN